MYIAEHIIQHFLAYLWFFLCEKPCNIRVSCVCKWKAHCGCHCGPTNGLNFFYSVLSRRRHTLLIPAKKLFYFHSFYTDMHYYNSKERFQRGRLPFTLRERNFVALRRWTGTSPTVHTGPGRSEQVLNRPPSSFLKPSRDPYSFASENL